MPAKKTARKRRVRSMLKAVWHTFTQRLIIL